MTEYSHLRQLSTAPTTNSCSWQSSKDQSRPNQSIESNKVAVVLAVCFPMHSQTRVADEKVPLEGRVGRVLLQDVVRSPSSQRYGPMEDGFVTHTPIFFLSNDGHTVESLMLSVTAARTRHGMPVSDSGGEVDDVGFFLFLLIMIQGSVAFPSRAAQPQFYPGLSHFSYMLERETFRQCHSLNNRNDNNDDERTPLSRHKEEKRLCDPGGLSKNHKTHSPCGGPAGQKTRNTSLRHESRSTKPP
jgi:hypothetical protein